MYQYLEIAEFSSLATNFWLIDLTHMTGVRITNAWQQTFSCQSTCHVPLKRNKYAPVVNWSSEDQLLVGRLIRYIEVATPFVLSRADYDFVWHRSMCSPSSI
jgi:hypothetical protein